MNGLNQVAELAKNASTKIVFSTTEYKGLVYVDMREYVTSSTEGGYTGFTKKGIRLRSDQFEEFLSKLQELKGALTAVEADKKPAS